MKNAAVASCNSDATENVAAELIPSADRVGSYQGFSCDLISRNSGALLRRTAEDGCPHAVCGLTSEV